MPGQATVQLRSDGYVAIDFGPGGPFVVIAPAALSQVLTAAYRAGIIDPSDRGWAWNK